MNQKRFLAPQIFNDESAESKLQRSKKISDLKNLGQVTERSLEAVKINTVKQFVKLGWKKTLVKLCESNHKNAHTIYAYALIGALKNIEWNQISDVDKKEAQEFTFELRKKLKKKKNRLNVFKKFLI